MTRRPFPATIAARLAPAALLMLLASGCVSLAPDYNRPALPVPATYAPDDSGAATATAAADIAWQAYFPDPVLQGLIATALDNNRDLRNALLRVEEARALYGIQRADQFPTVGVQAEGARSRVPGDLNLTGRPQVSSQYQVGLGMASWELDFWGRVRNLKNAALQNYLASDAAARAATLSLIAEVADSYLSLRELDERLALTRETIASREASLRIFRRATKSAPSRSWISPRSKRCGSRPRPWARTWNSPARRRPMRWNCCLARRWICPSCRRGWTTTPSCATCRPACLRRCWSTAPTSSRPNTA